MPGEETISETKRDALDEVEVAVGHSNLIFDSMRIEIALADGQTITIRGRRREPGANYPFYDAEVEGVTVSPGSDIDNQFYAERLLVAACNALLGWEIAAENDREVAGE